jgi:3-hydroxybutyryl-CoA dehydratase
VNGVVRVSRPQPPYEGRTFEQFRVGDRFSSEVAITDGLLSRAAELIGDYNPLHVDPGFAARSHFGGPILHGVITSALMSAPFGNLVAGTAIAYVEHAARFLAPVRPGDTLTMTWQVHESTPKPAHGGGLVKASCEARNQRGELVATAHGTMLVAGSLADAP